MAKLTIAELVARSDSFESEQRTPFAALPWQPSSQVIWNDSDDTTPIVQDGTVFGYFLEPSIIAEIKEWVSGENPEALVARVIQYAENDA